MKFTTILSIFFLINFLFMANSCKEDEVLRPKTITCNLENTTIYRTNPKSAEYQKLIEDYVKKGLPGIILLIKDKNGIYIGSAGMADIKKGVAMQPCNVSKICSITKLMIGVTIMSLQEKNLLSIDDPVSKYIPANVLNQIENGDKPLTIRDLMQHTTGFYDVIQDQGFYLQILNDPARHWSLDELLDYVYDKPAEFEFDPVNNAGYSNTNYVLLSMIIEKATNKDQARVLHEEVIDRVGMKETYYFYHDPLPRDRVAQGYFDLYNNGTLMNLSNWNTGSGNGYGGVYSTVWDMLLLSEALFREHTVISKASLDQMLVFHPTIENRKYLGLSVFKDFIDIGDPEKDYAWGHRGRDLSYSADLFYFPEHEATLSMMVNYGTDGESPLRETFLEMRDNVAKLVVKP